MFCLRLTNSWIFGLKPPKSETEKEIMFFSSFFLPLSSADSSFALINKATGLCLLKRSTRCLDVRWTTNDRLFALSSRKCIGAQGKSVGSEVSLYDCDDKSDLQKWECKNGTLLALKGTEFYITANADESISITRTVGPNNHFTITGTTSGACTRTYRGRVWKLFEVKSQWTHQVEEHNDQVLTGDCWCQRAGCWLSRHILWTWIS